MIYSDAQIFSIIGLSLAVGAIVGAALTVRPPPSSADVPVIYLDTTLLDQAVAKAEEIRSILRNGSSPPGGAA